MTALYIIAAIVIATGALIAAGTYIKGWRTKLFAFSALVVGVIETADFGFLPDNIEGPLLIGLALATAWLRQVTTTAPGQSE